MKKILAVLLASMMMVGLLAGCGGDDAIVGDWETSVEMADYLNQEFADEGMGDYIHLDSFAIEIRFSFDKDGTYTCSVDEAAFGRTVEGLKTVMKEGLTAYAEDMIAQWGLEGFSVDDVFAAGGTTLDELMDESFNAADLSDMTDAFAAEGNYKAKDGKLYLSDGLDHTIDEDVYDTYKIEGDELTLLESVGSDDDGFGADLYPIALKKVG